MHRRTKWMLSYFIKTVSYSILLQWEGILWVMNRNVTYKVYLIGYRNKNVLDPTLSLSLTNLSTGSATYLDTVVATTFPVVTPGFESLHLPRPDALYCFCFFFSLEVIDWLIIFSILLLFLFYFFRFVFLDFGATWTSIPTSNLYYYFFLLLKRATWTSILTSNLYYYFIFY